MVKYFLGVCLLSNATYFVKWVTRNVNSWRPCCLNLNLYMFFQTIYSLLFKKKKTYFVIAFFFFTNFIKNEIKKKLKIEIGFPFCNIFFVEMASEKKQEKILSSIFLILKNSILTRVIRTDVTTLHSFTQILFIFSKMFTFNFHQFTSSNFYL